MSGTSFEWVSSAFTPHTPASCFQLCGCVFRSQLWWWISTWSLFPPWAIWLRSSSSFPQSCLSPPLQSFVPKDSLLPVLSQSQILSAVSLYPCGKLSCHWRLTCPPTVHHPHQKTLSAFLQIPLLLYLCKVRLTNTLIKAAIHTSPLTCTDSLPLPPQTLSDLRCCLLFLPAPVPVIYFTHVNTVNLLFTVWVCFLGLFKKRAIMTIRMFVCFTCQSNQTQYKPLQRNLRGISENLKKPKEHLKLGSLCP